MQGNIQRKDAKAQKRKKRTTKFFALLRFSVFALKFFSKEKSVV